MGTVSEFGRKQFVSGNESVTEEDDGQQLVFPGIPDHLLRNEVCNDLLPFELQIWICQYNFGGLLTPGQYVV